MCLESPARIRGSGSKWYWTGIAALVAAALAWSAYRIFRVTKQPGPGLVSLATFWTLLYLGLSWLNRGRRLLALAAAEPAQPTDPAPVLYLRSFGADEKTAAAPAGSFLVNALFGIWQLLAYRTEEEQLAGVLDGFGVMTAVGRPGERLPQLGARRLYPSASDWQPVVRSLIQKAELVLIRVSLTHSVVWELSTAVRAQQPRSLVLLMPQRHREYDQVKQTLNPLFPKGLPDYKRGPRGFGSIRGVIWFQSDWQPHYERVTPQFLRARVTEPFAAGLTMALKPVFAQSGVHYRKPGLVWYLVAGFVALLLSVLSILVA